MIRAQPLSLAHKLKNIVDICEAADAAIDEQNLIKKGALDAGKENDGIEPGVVRKILARRKRIAKDPAETTRLEDLMTDYQFMLGEGREDTRPWTQTDDEISRVMALTNTSKPPKIEAIKKALGCSQGKAHKLRSIVAVRLAKKSSSSSAPREHEHLPESSSPQASAGEEHGKDDPVPVLSQTAAGGGLAPSLRPTPETGSSRQAVAVAESTEEGGAPNPVRDGEASADERDASASSSPPIAEQVAAAIAKAAGLPVPEPDLTIPPFLRRAPATVQP